jgi:hypothetical protein
MKGMGIIELMTLLILKREGIALKGDVIFLGTADEEAGGRLDAGSRRTTTTGSTAMTSACPWRTSRALYEIVKRLAV